jgi:anti-anti-sigma regulatory factor
MAEASIETLGVTLEPILDLRAAGPLKNTLQQSLVQGQPLVIDASAVSRMSTACVQVFTAAVLETQKSGAKLILRKSSNVFDAAFANLGLAAVLDTVKPQDTK